MKALTVEVGGVELAVLAMGEGRVVPGGVILPPGPIRILHPLEEGRIFRNGWHSWSFSGWMDYRTPWLPRALEARQPMVDHPACFEGDQLLSSAIAAIGDPDDKALLVGALGPDGWVEIGEGVLKGYYRGESAGWFLAYGPTTQIFADYLRCLCSEWKIPFTVRKAPRVWCSWYSFYHNIDESKILKVIKALSGLPIEVIQIDDGWQKSVGDWEANEKFPRGLQGVAEEIQKASFVPGIWVVPFIARENSQLAREHPGWILKDKTGEPVIAGNNWGGIFYSLDILQERVLNWLKELMWKLWSWGFRYVKLDFLYAGALPGQGGGKIAPEMAYRATLEALKEVWSDGYLLACGAPVIASLGACDGLRIGPNVAPYWSDGSGDPTAPGARNAIATSASRLWLKPAVHTDPDVVFFRSRYCLLTEKEKHILRDLAWVSGFKGTSDPPGWLNGREREELLAFLSSSPNVRQETFYRFKIADRTVDFEAGIG